MPSIDSTEMLYKTDIHRIDSASFDRFELRMDTIYKKILFQALKDGLPDSIIYKFPRPSLIRLSRPLKKND